MCSPLTALAEAAARFRQFTDLSEVARRAGADYDPEGRRIVIKYFNQLYVVTAEATVSRFEDEGEGDKNTAIPYNDRTLILQYLCSATEAVPRGQWLSFLDLPDGHLHYGPFQVDATGPLARTFGAHPHRLRAVAEILGGEPISLAHVGMKIRALPRIDLAVVLWEGDEEFPARANILFDAAAPLHLTTAALWVLGVELARRLLVLAGSEEAVRADVNWLGGKKESAGSVN